ncbi:MAG TPA: ATP cone domain-containing protein [Candidatus Paceibacterota bacterium]|nr:ATP cone domain-containing protein [Candidatus Paceibacterota bacterium]
MTIITKADGNTEEFKPGKLVSSLKKAGAKPAEVSRIVAAIESGLKDGMRTQIIYQKAFQLLRESNDPVAAKYSLRRAIFGLGPSGFPFEDFLGRIFEAEGYKTKRRLTIRGKCAVHEIDLAAYSPEHTFIAEAKFHMQPGTKSDLQVAMYSYARYLDLQSARVCKDDVCGIIDLFLITNTKFTQAAIKYGKCVGINMLSWDYPKDDTLQEKIERHKLYPITVLSRLPAGYKVVLLERGVILCTELLRRAALLQEIGLSGTKIDAIFNEINALYGHK